MSFDFQGNREITQELPAVPSQGGGWQRAPRGREPGDGPGLAIKLLLGLLLIAIVTLGAILVVGTQNTDTAQVPDAEATPTPPPAAITDPSPEIEELPDETPAYWQVFGVQDRLNVRSGPGTENPVIGSLSPGDRALLATGKRSSVNGSEWKQLNLDDGDGWVSANFLAPDIDPSDVDEAQATGCFQRSDGTTTRTVRIEFGDAGQIVGLVRIDTPGIARYESVDGQLRSGTATVIITDTASTRERQEQWSFGVSSIQLGGGAAVDIVSCASIVGLMPSQSS